MFHVLGEALVDLVPNDDGTVRPVAGGSPLNVAVGLAAAGVPVTLHTALGSDEYGDLVRAHLAERGVGLEALDVDRTGTARVRLTEGEASYELDLVTELPVPDLSGATGLHVGSVSALAEPGAAAVLAAVDRAHELGVPVSYDPNLRPGTGPAEDADAVRRLAARAHLVKLSDDDAALLAPGEDPEEVAAGLLGGHTELVVLTRGADGALAFSEVNSLHVAAHVAAAPVTVVDTIGAGDAFMGGLLAAGDRTLRERLEAAAKAAGACCAQPGA